MTTFFVLVSDFKLCINTYDRSETCARWIERDWQKSDCCRVDTALVLPPSACHPPPAPLYVVEQAGYLGSLSAIIARWLIFTPINRRMFGALLC